MVKKSMLPFLILGWLNWQKISMRYFQKSLVIMKFLAFPLDLGIREYELNVDLIRTPFLFNADSYQIPETISPSDLNQ